MPGSPRPSLGRAGRAPSLRSILGRPDPGLGDRSRPSPRGWRFGWRLGPGLEPAGPPATPPVARPPGPCPRSLAAPQRATPAAPTRSLSVSGDPGPRHAPRPQEPEARHARQARPLPARAGHAPPRPPPGLRPGPRALRGRAGAPRPRPPPRQRAPAARPPPRRPVLSRPRALRPARRSPGAPAAAPPGAPPGARRALGAWGALRHPRHPPAAGAGRGRARPGRRRGPALRVVAPRPPGRGRPPRPGALRPACRRT